MINRMTALAMPLSASVTLSKVVARTYSKVQVNKQVDVQKEIGTPREFKMHNIEFHKKFADSTIFLGRPCHVLEELPKEFDPKAWHAEYVVHMTKVLDLKLKSMLASQMLRRDGVLSHNVINIINGSMPSEEAAKTLGEYELWRKCLDNL